MDFVTLKSVLTQSRAEHIWYLQGEDLVVHEERGKCCELLITCLGSHITFYFTFLPVLLVLCEVWFVFVSSLGA